GDVGSRSSRGNIRCGLEPEFFSRRQNRIECQSFFKQNIDCEIIDLDCCQNFFMAITAARIGVYRVDQLANRRYAITKDRSRSTLRGGNKFEIDNEYAMIAA